MKLNEKLLKIQTELKAPKNLHNSFGNYYYRNAESIYESVKHLLTETKTTLLMQDEIVQVGDRFYVKATATLKDTETDESISASAYAREPLDKKGQDQSQITGSTSSFARKYALNGLFILDDTKDEDSDELKNEKKNKSEVEKITPIQIDRIVSLVDEIGLTRTEVLKHIEKTGADDIVKLTKVQADTYITFLDKLKQKKSVENAILEHAKEASNGK